MAVRPPEGGLDLEDLFRAHATPLLRLAVVLTGDHGLAEELVQEAFVRRPPRQPPAGARRGAGVPPPHGDQPVPRTPPTPARGAAPSPRPRSRRGAAADADVVRRDDQRRVADAVRSLPHRQRDCIVLRFYEDLSDTEIAEALGISPGSVKTHLHRARATLADLLEALR